MNECLQNIISIAKKAKGAEEAGATTMATTAAWGMSLSIVTAVLTTEPFVWAKEEKHANAVTRKKRKNGMYLRLVMIAKIPQKNAKES